MITLAPSVLAADLACLGEQILITREEKISCIHFDVMDGMFVPSLSFGFPVLEALRRCTDQKMDVHLMIVDPIRYIDRFAKAGADHITVHYEACDDLGKVIRAIHDAGCTCGVSVKPATPAEAILPWLDQIELALVMTVEPGFGGQKYIDAMTEKIRVLSEYSRQAGLDLVVEADGGIYADNIQTVMEAGCTQIVCGSSVFNGDIRKNIRALQAKVDAFEEFGG